jgi:hypothetical protein
MAKSLADILDRSGPDGPNLEQKVIFLSIGLHALMQAVLYRNPETKGQTLLGLRAGLSMTTDPVVYDMVSALIEIIESESGFG